MSAKRRTPVRASRSPKAARPRAYSHAKPNRVFDVSLADVRTSPENDRLYRPVNPSDPEIQALAQSIRRHGIMEPLVVTRDGWILSGHRRFAAARLVGVERIPCRIASIRRTDDPDTFVRMLRECNRYREKTLDEKLREEIVSADPHEAYESLLAHRRRKSDMSDSGLAALEIGGHKRRKAISVAKHAMLLAAQAVIADRRDFWPLSDRSIHYALLNDPPLRHTAKPQSTYCNDRASYQDLTDLLTRARLVGEIPWEAIADETRPVVLWQADPDPQPFIRRELNGFLKGYWRDYQQSQSIHVEIIAEKLTIRGMVEPVAQRYCLPLTIGRGYCSIIPRRELAQRFRLSGRDQLVALMLSDFDPDGENIAESFARSLRDDFGVTGITAIKVALTAQQVKALALPPQMKAKAGSSSYRRFTARHGDDVYELEAMPPADLQRALSEAIEQVLDLKAFNAEIKKERQDAAFIETIRRRAIHVIEQTGMDRHTQSD